MTPQASQASVLLQELRPSSESGPAGGQAAVHPGNGLRHGDFGIHVHTCFLPVGFPSFLTGLEKPFAEPELEAGSDRLQEKHLPRTALGFRGLTGW